MGDIKLPNVLERTNNGKTKLSSFNFQAISNFTICIKFHLDGKLQCYGFCSQKFREYL